MERLIDDDHRLNHVAEGEQKLLRPGYCLYTIAQSVLALLASERISSGRVLSQAENLPRHSFFPPRHTFGRIDTLNWQSRWLISTVQALYYYCASTWPIT